MFSVSSVVNKNIFEVLLWLQIMGIEKDCGD
jgi:hypothetical protein